MHFCQFSLPSFLRCAYWLQFLEIGDSKIHLTCWESVKVFSCFEQSVLFSLQHLIADILWQMTIKKEPFQSKMIYFVLNIFDKLQDYVGATPARQTQTESFIMCLPASQPQVKHWYSLFRSPLFLAKENFSPILMELTTKSVREGLTFCFLSFIVNHQYQPFFFSSSASNSFDLILLFSTFVLPFDDKSKKPFIMSANKNPIWE